MDLNRFPTTEGRKVGKKEAEQKLISENILEMRQWQAKLYSEDKQGLLIVLQAMDAAGKRFHRHF